MKEIAIDQLLEDMNALIEFLYENNCKSEAQLVERVGIIVMSLSAFYVREMGLKLDPSNKENTIH